MQLLRYKRHGNNKNIGYYFLLSSLFSLLSSLFSLLSSFFFLLSFFFFLPSQLPIYTTTGAVLTYLPVDFSFDVCNVEEHFLPGQVRGHRQGSHFHAVLDVDRSATLHGQIEHFLEKEREREKRKSSRVKTSYR